MIINPPFRFFALIVAAWFGVVPMVDAQPNLVPRPASPQNGVYIATTRARTKVLELNDGHFRLWEDANSSALGGQPLKGEYSASGDSIILNHGKPRKWVFRSIDGLLTIWSPLAAESILNLPHLNPIEIMNFGDGNILVKTNRQPEEVWDNRKRNQSHE